MLNVELEERETPVVDQKIKKAQYDWRYENSIGQTKKWVEVEGIVEHKYAPWRTNSYFANFSDTVLYANEMNMNYNLDNVMQYHYYMNSKIRLMKRWFKKEKPEKDDDLALIQQFYKYNRKRAIEALSVLTPEQIKVIRKMQEKGDSNGNS